MLKHLLFAIASLCLMGTAGSAEEWTFHYGPDYGVDKLESYTRVSAGSNMMLVHIHDASRKTIAVNLTLDTFDNGGKIVKSLQAGEPVKLDVLRQNDRYERVIEPSQFAWKEQPEKRNVMIVFLLTKDDLIAMIEGRAVFIWTGSLQSRFGLVDAEVAILKLASILKDN